MCVFSFTQNKMGVKKSPFLFEGDGEKNKMGKKKSFSFSGRWRKKIKSVEKS